MLVIVSRKDPIIPLRSVPLESDVTVCSLACGETLDGVGLNEFLAPLTVDYSELTKGIKVLA